jgi:23S rRNA-/tRNA-specific pseudouridylate synthase
MNLMIHSLVFSMKRRHLQHLQHHILGDTSYGKGRLNQALRDGVRT